MTIQDYIKLEKDRLNKIMENQAPLYLAAQSALVDFSKRIFEDGKTVDGTQYEYNDSKPLYVNPGPGMFGDTENLKPPRGKPYGGKSGRTKFKSGKAHKTTWVKSYKDLRELVKREFRFVNFEAHGELKLDIENRSSGAMTPRKINDGEYVIAVSEKNRVKLFGKNGDGGLFRKFPRVFIISEAEKDVFNFNYNKELLRLIKEGRP